MNISIDPELKYCLQCNEEYRAEIEVCADCGSTLLRGDEILRKSHGNSSGGLLHIVPGEPLVPILKGGAIQIKQLKSVLKTAGFDSLVNADPGQCGKG